MHLLTLFLAFFSFPSFALPPWPEAIRGSWKEMSTPEVLPPFCRIQQLNSDENLRRIHQDIPGTNHFCDAKVKHHICLKYSGKDRSACLSYLARAVHDAIRGAQERSPNHYLLPYLHTEYANFLAEAGSYPQAAQEYLTAIRKNKRYLPAYLKLAEAWIKTQEYDQAEKALTYALKLQKNKRHEAYIQKQLARVAKLKRGEKSPSTTPP
jgi:tetratricopeptide (TPR) repeat protein